MSELKMVVSFRPGGWHEMTILGELGSVKFVIALYLSIQERSASSLRKSRTRPV